MFNPLRAARYLLRVLGILLPVLGALLALAMFTELFQRDAVWREEVLSWKFWVAVVRDMAPGAVALIAALFLASRFVQRLYALDSLWEAGALVSRCLLGLWSFRPWLRLAGGAVEGDQDHILQRVGGPGHLVVYNDTAAVLERGGRFTRVEGRGFPRLQSLERVYRTVDLRPLRYMHSVSAMSREGIPIECEADISLQIDCEDVPPSDGAPFPASSTKVFQAATSEWVGKSDVASWDRSLTWSDRLLYHETDHRLRTILASYPLDQLIGLGSPDAEDPREAIRKELHTGLETAAERVGARIHSVELGDIRVQHEITAQWIDAWKAEWQRWSVERRSLGSARQAEQLERARNQAQVMMLTTISEAFRPLVGEQRSVTSRLILARLFMVLSRAPSDPLSRVFLPAEALRTLQSLRELIGANGEKS